MECITVIATVAIAVFTGCLWWSTDKLWKTTEESIKLGRDEFIATHPPEIRVHTVSLDYGSQPPHGGGVYTPWKIQCFIDNIGGSTAIIRESNLTFKRLERLPAILPFSDECHMLSEKPLERGEDIIGLLFLDEEMIENLNGEAWDALREDGSPFYFFGYIDYLDNIDTMRRTAFCRRYNIKTKRFAKVEDEDYEYSY